MTELYKQQELWKTTTPGMEYDRGLCGVITEKNHPYRHGIIGSPKEQLLNRRPSKPNGNFVCENQPYLKYCFTKQIICPICECSLWQLIYSNNGNRTKLFKYKCKKCKAVLKTRKEFKKWN